MAKLQICSELYPGLVALVDDEDLDLVSPYSWCINPAGYVVARVGGRVEYLHRVLLPGVPLVDHASGDRLDNRRSNLRAATATQNSANRAKQPGASSQFKGVYRLPSGHWGAQIQSSGRKSWLGTFRDEEDAATAYDWAAIAAFGQFARTNLDIVLEYVCPTALSNI